MTMHHATIPIVRALLSYTTAEEDSQGYSQHLAHRPACEDIVSSVNLQDSFGNTVLHLASAKNLK